MSLGGSARLPLKWDVNGNLSAGVEIVPQVSYFFFDQWELMFSAKFNGSFYQNELVRTPKEPLRWGAQLGVNYYFDLGLGFYPYAGLAVGADMADFKPTSSRLSLEIPVGLAFVVGEHLMIQVGAPLKMIFEGYGVTTGSPNFEWSPGYVGARVLF
jgi:hypothetical protein